MDKEPAKRYASVADLDAIVLFAEEIACVSAMEKS
jgi:hypothetical protein